jgi:hypothetical protein
MVMLLHTALLAMLVSTTPAKCPPKKTTLGGASQTSLPTAPAVKTLNKSFVGKVTVPYNYTLTFTMTPREVDPAWTNVLHYSRDNTDGSRMPAIYVWPGSTRLHVRVGSDKSPNGGIDSINLPINATTKVRLQAIGKDVSLFFNGTFAGYYEAPGTRFSGEAFQYMSNNWTAPARAILSAVKMTATNVSGIQAISKIANTNAPVQSSYKGKVVVPENYTLSFQFTPTGTSDVWTNILHYSRDNTDGSRMPSIYVIPGSTRLHVRVGSDKAGNGGVDTVGLPMNQTTTVLLQALGKDVYVYFNNTLAGYYEAPGTRFSGEAFHYISNSWYKPAVGRLQGVKMTSTNQWVNSQSLSLQSTGSFAVQPSYKGKVVVPYNYTLSFKVTPTGTSDAWTNVLHYSRDNTDGSRMPAVYVWPGSSRLHVRVGSDNATNGGIDTRALPINETTTVLLQAIGKDVSLFFNGTLAGYYEAPGTRFSGEAFHYVSSTWARPLVGRLEAITMTANNQTTYNTVSSIQSSGSFAVQPSYKGRVIVPADYTLSFSITPRGTVPEWTNLLHYTRDNTDGSRMPSIYVIPSSSRLHVRVGSDQSPNGGMDTMALPMNQTTFVQLQAIGAEVSLFFNGTLAGFYEAPGTRFSGSAYHYVSNTWHAPAPALLSSIQMLPTTATSVRLATSQVSNGQKTKPTYRGKVNVPSNYVLSFNITPSGINHAWTNIMHFTKDNTDGSRMPSIYFWPGSTRLHIRVGSDKAANGGIDTVALPMNQTTKVTIQTLGGEGYVFFNNSFAGFFETPGTRFSGTAYFFMSNTWYAPAEARVSNVRMIGTSKMVAPTLSKVPKNRAFQVSNGYKGKVEVPYNYTLSFRISPKGVSDSWTNILHYTRDNTDGSRMPAIYMWPGSTRMHVRVGSDNATNGGIDAPALPINDTTTVLLQALGSEVFLYFNGTPVGFYDAPGTRFSGLSYFYLSNTWHQPARVVLDSYSLAPCSAPTFTSAKVNSINPVQVQRGYQGKVVVPYNYTLSFKMTPTGTSGSWSNLLHYTRDITDGSRMPSIYVIPGSSRLHVRVGSDLAPNGGIDTMALPMNQTTTVLLQALGKDVYVYLNGTLGGYYEAPGTRFSGPAYFFSSNLWYTPAPARLESVQMISTNQSAYPSLSLLEVSNSQSKLKSGLVGRVQVPQNYTLGLQITPRGVENGWSNLIHFTRDNTDGSRMPSIYFWPGTTRLHIRVGSENATNGGLDTAALPLNQRTTVELSVLGRNVKVYYNGTEVGSYTAPGTPFSGSALLYMSNPWYVPANADMRMLVFEQATC